MPIGAGWDSPGARLRTERFQRRREEVVGGLGPMLAEGLQSATTATDQSLTELASNQGMFNLGRPTMGPAPPPAPRQFDRPRPPGTLTALATGFAPDPPIPLRRDAVPLDLAAGARSAREFGAALEEGARGDVFRRGRFTPRAAGHLAAVLRETGLRPEEFQAIAEAAEEGHPEARAFIDQVRQPLAEEETGMAIAGLAGLQGQQTDFGGTLVDIAQRFPDILSPVAAANLSNLIRREGGIVPGLGREQLPAEGTTLLGALRAEVEFLRPGTAPIGRFVGGLIGQQLAPTTPGPLRALGVPDIPGTQRARDIGADVGGAVAPEVLVPTNVIPIPIADEVLRVLAKGVPLAARLLTRTGRDATRAELRELATAAGRWLTGAAPITPAERELGQQGVEALTREAAEAVPARAAGEAATHPTLNVPVVERVADLPAGERIVYSNLSPTSAEDAARGTGRVWTAEQAAEGFVKPQNIEGSGTIAFQVREGAEPIAASGRSTVYNAGDLEPLGFIPEERIFPEDVLAPSGQTIAERRARGELAVPEAVARRAEDLPQVAGGAPLTSAEVASRRAAGADLVAEAIPQSGRRAGRDVWRRFFGARQLSAKERLVWSRQVYRDAEQGGFKIAARGETQADEVVGIMERVMSEQRAPINNFPERQRPFVQSLYDRIDRTTQRLIDADPNFANIALEDYFPHLFKSIKPGAARLGQATGFVTKPGFKRPRKLTGTLGEILNERPDLDLVSWDPVDFVTRHEAAADNYIASLEAIRAGKASGHILPATQNPGGWVRPDFAPFKLRQTLQHWVMEPDFAQTMEQMFGKSAFDKHGVLKLAKQVRTTAFGLKVFGGLFQQLDFMWRGAGLGVSELARGRPAQALKAAAAWPRAIARGLSPGVDEALNKAAIKNPELKALYDHGLAAGVDPSFSETALRDVAGELAPIPGVRQVLDAMTTKWYGRFHTEMLEQAALVNLQKNIRKGLPLDEAARVAVEETNVFFSSIPAWQSVWKSATVRDAMKFPFFATGELEGWFRLPVQAPAGFAGMMAATVAFAEMMSLAFTGKPLSLDQLTPFQRERNGLKPSKILTGDIPFVDFNSGFLRPELPWKGPMGRNIFLDLLGQADTPFRWALDPGFALSTRLGQLPRLAIDLASIARGEAPAFGERVEGLGDAARFLVGQVSPISVSGLTGTERGRIGVGGAGIQVSGFNVSAENLFELLGRRFEEITGEPFNPETDFVRARQEPELVAILDEMRKQGVAVGSEGAVAAEAREEVVQQAARDSLTQFADGVRAGNADAGRRFGEKFSDWKTFAAGAAELSIFGRDFPDPTTPEGQILAEFYEITPDAFLDGDPEQGTFTTDWVAFENARDEKLAQMPQAWRDAYEAQLRLPPELQDVEARYNAARELRNDLEEVGEFVGLSREDYQLVKRLRAAVTRAREEAWNDPGRSGRELAPVASFIETEGQRLGYDERLINWTLALTSERHRARNYNPAYVDFLGEHEAELRLFYPQLFTRRVTDELLRRP